MRHKLNEAIYNLNPAPYSPLDNQLDTTARFEHRYDAFKLCDDNFKYAHAYVYLKNNYTL